MRIMFVTPEFMEKGRPSGGMPNYIYRTAKALQCFGHEVIIVAGGYKMSKKTDYDGIDLYKVCTYSQESKSDFYNFLLSSLYREIKIQKMIHKICDSKKIDLIQYAGHSGNGIFHHVSVPAVMRMSSYFRFTYSSYLSYSKRQVELFSLLERIAAKRMNCVYAPSKVLASALSKDIKRKVFVLETPYFNYEIETDDTAYKTLLGDKKYILYFGRIEPDKGVFLIADIAKQLLHKYKDYYLVYVGKDCIVKEESTIKLIKKQIGNEKRVIYRKELSHKELFPIIQNASVILMPSYRENISNACMESMDYEKIVIATEGASYEQLITDRENGFLMKIGDSKSLWEGIDRALNLSENEKKEMGIRAKKRIERLYPKVSIPKLINYYNFVIKYTANQSNKHLIGRK